MSKHFTDEDLKDFIPINRDLWPNLQAGSRIMYEKTNGEKLIGGYVKSTIVNPNKIQITNNNRTWSTNYDNISILYLQKKCRM